jgi:NADH-quinone oxidoreductase subunit E
MNLSPELKTALDRLKQAYPLGRSVLMPALYAVQKEFGHIPLELEPELAAHLGIPREVVHETSTFYFMFNNQPVGRHHIYLCGNLSCWLRGFEPLNQHLEKKLGIREGQTTADGKFTLSVVECLGLCDQAPVMLINGVPHGHLTPEKVDQILDSLE